MPGPCDPRGPREPAAGADTRPCPPAAGEGGGGPSGRAESSPPGQPWEPRRTKGLPEPRARNAAPSPPVGPEPRFGLPGGPHVGSPSPLSRKEHAARRRLAPAPGYQQGEFGDVQGREVVAREGEALSPECPVCRASEVQMAPSPQTPLAALGPGPARDPVSEPRCPSRAGGRAAVRRTVG